MSLQWFINWITADYPGVIVGFVFMWGIVRMLFDAQKPPVDTGVVTGVCLIVLATGGSYWSSATAVITGINGVFWLMLAVQRWRQDRQQ
jgi:hypothetical protein